MRSSLALVLVVCSLAVAQNAPKPPNRRTLFRRLDAHLSSALTRASLGDKDRKKLEQAQQLVRQAADASGAARPKPRELHDGFKEIEKRTSKFQEDDRRAVLEDIRQLRALGVGEVRRRRAPPVRPYPPWPGPRYPRIPRWALP